MKKNRNYTKYIYTLFVFILLMPLFSCQKKDESVLRVGMELEYPPFETVDESGKATGVSVELAKELGKYLGKKVEIVSTPYPSLIPSLESGKIDIIISSMTITDERLERVNFSDPYTTSQLMMLVSKDSKVQSYKDLDDPSIVIASKTGTIGAMWAAKNAPLAKIKSLDEEAAAVLEVANGYADVFIYDPLSIIRHHDNYPNTTRMILEPLPNTTGWGIAVSKKDEELLKQINTFIKQAKQDGTFDRIRNENLKDKMEEFKKYNLEFFF